MKQLEQETQAVRPRNRSETTISKQATNNTPVWKRTLDVVFIVLAAPTVVPFMAAIAVFIKLASKGPILFKQERIGYLGSTFVCYKFRSMRVNAEVKSHKDHTTHLIKKSDVPMVKMDVKGDTRLIPLGSILRATGLDELPQLWNVLRGEMSLVGPRPCVPYEYDQYLPWQKQRFDVVPGLTGLWQVSGKNMTTFNEMINLDILYTKQSSISLDLKIILKTIPALIKLARQSRKLRQASTSEQSGKVESMEMVTAGK
jgi:lipopolysaccharide/colanic/teichoic acid biosynthesis glycosyltransferase